MFRFADEYSCDTTAIKSIYMNVFKTRTRFGWCFTCALVFFGFDTPEIIIGPTHLSRRRALFWPVEFGILEIMQSFIADAV